MISKKILNEFPRSSKYDFNWMAENEMGPNAVWLTEFLCEKLGLKEGQKVLDMGCGKACSSIFLAKEYGVNVWATDLWIDATTNFRNVKKMKAEDKVFPIYSEAHQLPYADEFFDVIVAVDSYTYFGTDDLYLNYILKFLKPGGTIAIVCPGLKQEVNQKIVDFYDKFWDPDMFCFHTVEWWKKHWEKTALVDINNAEELKDMWQLWYEWESELEAIDMINPNKGSDLEFLKLDNGKYVQFFRMIATKK